MDYRESSSLSRSSRPSSSVAVRLLQMSLRLLQTLWLIRQRSGTCLWFKFSFNGTEDFFINRLVGSEAGVCAVATAVAPSDDQWQSQIQVVPQPMFSRLRNCWCRCCGSWCSDANQTTHRRTVDRRRVSSAWFAYAIRSSGCSRIYLRYRLCRLYA